MVNANRSQAATPTRIEPTYCPICTHTVPTEVIWRGKRLIVKPGQKCARCHSPIDAGVVMARDRAA